MMGQQKTKEFTGKTVREAIEAAAAALGVAEDSFEYEVVREPERSLFGLVRTGEACIRVVVPSSATSQGADTLDESDEDEDWDEEIDDEADLDDSEAEQAPVSQAAEKRDAVLLRMISKYSASSVSASQVFNNSSISPSAKAVVASDITLSISGFPLWVISSKDFEKRKSPTSTLGSFPHSVFAVEEPRRVWALSTTSSWRRVAVWMNSTMAA